MRYRVFGPSKWIGSSGWVWVIRMGLGLQGGSGSSGWVWVFRMGQRCIRRRAHVFSNSDQSITDVDR